MSIMLSRALTWLRRTRVPLLATVIVAVLTAFAGVQLGAARQRARHAATAVTLTGTVTWSNSHTRLIAFDTDGVVRRPNQGDTIYQVIADGWEDIHGVQHVDETYPSCLSAPNGDAVSMDHHRAVLTVIDWDTGGAQAVHVALHVRCLD
jgi:hypothetical protein